MFKERHYSNFSLATTRQSGSILKYLSVSNVYEEKYVLERAVSGWGYSQMRAEEPLGSLPPTTFHTSQNLQAFFPLVFHLMLLCQCDPCGQGSL